MRQASFQLLSLVILSFVVSLSFPISIFAQGDNSSIKFGVFYPPTITNTPTPTQIPPSPLPKDNQPENDNPPPPTNPQSPKTSAPSLPQIRPSPTPTPSKANLVIQLVNSLQKNCYPAGYVSSRNYRCLYNLTPRLSSPVLEELSTSAVRNDWLQCVGFVRAAITLTTDITLEKWIGNAIAYARNVPFPYRFMRNTSTNTIRLEDIPIWDYADSVGHIAYVVYVYDARNFQVAEANYGDSAAGKVRLRNTTTGSPGLIGWLRKG